MAIIRVIDLETTGLSPPAGVCELAFVDVRNDGSGWRVWTGDSELVNPGMPIPPEASAIHHLIDEDVEDATIWRVISNRIPVSFEDDGDRPMALAAHNAKFERQWVDDGIAGGLPWICTYKVALRVWPEAPSHGNQVLRYWLKPAGLVRDYAQPAHRAMPDAYTTAFILREALDRGVAVDDMIAWTAEPAKLSTCPIGKWRGMPWAEVDAGFLRWMLGKDFDEDVLHCAFTELERRKS